MQGRLPGMILAFILFLSCSNENANSLESQLKVNFSSHLKNVDPSLSLDSFKLVRTDSLFEKQGSMFDVFIYQREDDKIKMQLKNAIAQELADSAAFYSEETNYMEKEIDSLRKRVASADTTRAFAVAIHCRFWLRKNDRFKSDSVLYLFDNSMKLLNADRIDSEISRSSRNL